MAMPMPVAVGPNDGTGGGPHCRSTSATDRAADDRASHGAASRRALSHDIRCRHGKAQHQNN